MASNNSQKSPEMLDSKDRTIGMSSSITDSARPNNVQRIAQRKHQVRSFPRNKKLEKLAVYSSCKVILSWLVIIVFINN